MKLIRSILPESVKKPLRKIKRQFKLIPYYGKTKYCPVCQHSSRKFRPYGNPPRKNAQCVRCGSLERHRITWLFFNQHTNLFDAKPKQMLHIAPEACFQHRLKQRVGTGYLSADLNRSSAMVKMDITAINYPDQSFDIIYCSHVLEHIEDDLQAMREIHRVLKNTGWAILLVPIIAEKTFEDPSITSPAERLRVFGQTDHVRKYGPDYIDRLRQAGFTVKKYGASDLGTPQDTIKMGLTGTNDEVFFCTK